MPLRVYLILSNPIYPQNMEENPFSKLTGIQFIAVENRNAFQDRPIETISIAIEQRILLKTCGFQYEASLQMLVSRFEAAHMPHGCIHRKSCRLND